MYDQLNRLLNTRQHTFGAASGSFQGSWTQSNTNTTDNYAETFRYDANGNILQLNRNGNSQHPGGLAMDRLNYTYRDGTNQLWSVQDGIAAGAYAGDIDNQGGSNYSYDRIGNLIGDVSENISQVNWTVYGKIGNIQKKQAFLGYVYNAGGERVVKQYLPYATNQCAGCDENTAMVDLEVFERNSTTPNVYKASKTITFLSEYTDERYRDYSAIIDAGLAQCTPQCNVQPELTTSDADIYIRDATGNVLAVYHYDRKTGQLRWSEQHLYGSARLGMYLPEKSVTSVSTESKQREVGYWGKQIFELSNHLGNVLATITDKKLQVSTNTTSTDYFEADVQTVQDYYAFGMQMHGRKLSGVYRYGFNGKENDNEVKGEGNQQDYGARIYDNRVGRFLSVDPLAKSFAWYTPYQFAGNMPIAAIDLDGEEQKIVINWHEINGEVGSTKIVKDDFTNTNKLHQSLSAGLNSKTTYDIEGTKFNSTNAAFSDGFDAYKQGTKNPRSTQNTIRPNNGTLTIDIYPLGKKDAFVNIKFDNAAINEKELALDAIRGSGQVGNFVGNRLEEAGYATSLFPGGQAVGLSLIGIGKGVALGADVIDIGADLLENKNRDALIKGGFLGIGLVIGAGTEKIPLKKLGKQSIDTYFGRGIGAIKDGYLESRPKKVEESDKLDIKIYQKK